MHWVEINRQVFDKKNVQKEISKRRRTNNCAKCDKNSTAHTDYDIQFRINDVPVDWPLQ